MRARSLAALTLTMADSGSLRVKRHRLHAAGDHHLCRHLPAAPVAAVDVSSAEGADPEDFDPKAEMRELAVRLRDAHQADRGNAILARELRATLLALAGMGPGDDEPDLLAEILSQPNSHWPDLCRVTT